MDDCIFCKIIAGQIPSSKVYEDECVLIFKDITPQAPIHLLAIPKKHLATIQDVSKEELNIMTTLYQAVQSIVIQMNLGQNGYRMVINAGEHAGQAVAHLHIHILAGRDMSWPPG